MMNPLTRLRQFGQAVYLDEIRRSWLHDGTFRTLIERDGLSGVTSNPAIFSKAIVESSDYHRAIADLAEAGADAAAAYEELVVADIRAAADLFRPLYDRSGGADGYVSLEVSPELAHDTTGTVAEGRHLWRRLDRPNVFIKVPATAAGLAAIRTLISEGVNVNVTLLFGLPRYREVVEAYLAGLEQRLAAGQSLTSVASVASFFLSRIDVMVDPQLDAARQAGGEMAELARSLRGTAAVASAKCAYDSYRDQFGWPDPAAGGGRSGLDGRRFAKLWQAGARPQWLLWASTSTKDPSYPDTKYVEPLIGPETINTMPLETVNAYRDHGQPASRVTEDLALARSQLAALSKVGIDLDAVTQRLEDEGVEKFVKPFRGLLTSLTEALGSFTSTGSRTKPRA